MKIIRVIIIATFFFIGATSGGPASAQGPCGEFYTVLPGDTLSDIAELCEVTVTDILALNPEITDPTRLFVGLRLRIPQKGEGREPILAISPMCGPPGTRVLVLASGFPPNVLIDLGVTRQESEYFVVGRVRSDTFGKLDTEVTIPASAGVNRTYVIQAEASLDNSDFKGISSTFSVTPSAEDPRQPFQYFIRSGDTLTEVAVKFGRSTQAILDVNPGLADLNQFQEGKRIVIPAVQPEDPRVSLVPTCAPPGAKLQVYGDKFLTNNIVYLNFARWQARPIRALSTVTDLNGTFSADLELYPEARAGDFWVVTVESANNPRGRGISNLLTTTWPINPNAPKIYTVRSNDTLNGIAENFGRTPLSIIAVNPEIENLNQIQAGTRIIIPPPTASVIISPANGPAGSQLQVRGQGFPPAVKVELGLGRRADSYEVVETVITNELGAFSTQLDIPITALSGQRWVAVTLLARAGVTEVSAVSNPFNVTQTVRFGSGAVITIWPLSGPPGSELLVSAAGFPANVLIEVGLARVGNEPQEFIETWTDINGSFATEFIIPQEARLGESWVVVAQSTDAPVSTVTSEVFTITASLARFFSPFGSFP